MDALDAPVVDVVCVRALRDDASRRVGRAPDDSDSWRCRSGGNPQRQGAPPRSRPRVHSSRERTAESAALSLASWRYPRVASAVVAAWLDLVGSILSKAIGKA